MAAPDLSDREFWISNASVVLANPRDREALNEAGVIEQWLEGQTGLTAHVLFRTSGSTGQGKWVALAKDALLASARAVNEFLGVTPEDRWLQTLPLFHVGGMGIAARAHAAGCRAIEGGGQWDAARCHEQLMVENITLTSLVPTQLTDLVRLNLPAPPSLRAVLIGGGKLDDELYRQAMQLGWPVRETYGMTETASQVATARAGEKCLSILPCWQVQTDDSGRIQISGEPLLSAYVGINDEGECFLEDPKENGWLKSNDLGCVSGNHLEIQGRVDRCVKILGELINLTDVEESVSEAFTKANGEHADFAVMALEDERAGHKLILCIEGEGGFDDVLDFHYAECHPLHRIAQVVYLTSFPHTVIGKIAYSKLQEELAAVISK